MGHSCSLVHQEGAAPQPSPQPSPSCCKQSHTSLAARAVGYPKVGWKRRAFIVPEEDALESRPLSGGNLTIGAPRSSSGGGVRFEAARAMFEEVEEPEAPECSICLEAIDTEEEHKLPCSHVLHRACAAKLPIKKGKVACPLCRQSFVPRGQVCPSPHIPWV